MPGGPDEVRDGQARPGGAKHGQAGPAAGLVYVDWEAAWLPTSQSGGGARRDGQRRPGEAGKARHGQARPSTASPGQPGTTRHGQARPGTARHGQGSIESRPPLQTPSWGIIPFRVGCDQRWIYQVCCPSSINNTHRYSQREVRWICMKPMGPFMIWCGPLLTSALPSIH